MAPSATMDRNLTLQEQHERVELERSQMERRKQYFENGAGSAPELGVGGSGGFAKENLRPSYIAYNPDLGAQNAVTSGHPLGARGLTLDNVEELFRYQPWDKFQVESGNIVREMLTTAAKAILRVVPEGPSRTRALNAVMDARMLANQAITFNGRL